MTEARKLITVSIWLDEVTYTRDLSTWGLRQENCEFEGKLDNRNLVSNNEEDWCKITNKALGWHV